MKKLELEVKVLNVDKEALINKLKKLGAKELGASIENTCVYDLPGINTRYLDILSHLSFYRHEPLKREVAIERLELLFEEVDYLLTIEDRDDLANEYQCTSLNDLWKRKDIIEVVNSKFMKKFMKRFFLNHKKWMRLRTVDGVTKITIKHILPDNDTRIQQLHETEVTLSSHKEANELLEAIGYHHKNHFEKERITYFLDNHEIDIDTWPSIPTYFEIEGETEEDIERILKRLGYTMEDTVSCTADKVFKMYGKSMFDKRDLTLDDTKLYQK